MLALMLQHLDILNVDLRICSHFFYVHVPCWCSLEYWNMSEKTCADVGINATTS